MLTLHILPRLDRAESLSPFCLRVATYLRLAGIPHQTVYTIDTSVGPKGKLPVVDDEDARLGDSYFIIEHLKRTRGDALDAQLSARDRAIGLAASRMLDEHLYWAIVHSRWFDDRYQPRMLDLFFGKLSPQQREVVAPVALDAMRTTLYAHGIGRHTPAEIAKRGQADLSALAAILADQPFMFGARPTAFDAAAYGFLSNILDVDMDTALQRHAAAQPNLVAYCGRMREQYG